MLKESKWISYAIGVLQASQKGANNIQSVAQAVGGSESYIAKVIAILRKAGLINTKYELAKPLDQITIGELMAVTYTSPLVDKHMDYIARRIISTMTLSIQDVLNATTIL